MSVLTTLPAEAPVATTSPVMPLPTAWWRGLARTTSSGRIIPAIDGLRCLAILAVIAHHLGGYVAQKTPGLELAEAKQSVAYRLIDIGNCGVQLFFVISGFILALPFAEHRLCGGKPVRIKKFLWRRVTRLHPPYLLNLAVMTLLLIAVKHETWSDLSPHLLASSFYIHNLVYHSMSSVNFVAWSLEIEVQFYLLAPLLTLVYLIPQTLLRRSLIAAAATSVMAWKWSAGMPVSYPLSGSVLYYLDYFLCGLLLADWQALGVRRPLATKSTGVAWDALGLLAGATGLALVLNSSTWHLLPVALFPACAAVLRGPRLNWLFSLPLLVIVGGMCYTTYLYHFGVISLVGRFVAPWTEGLSYAAALLLQAIVIAPAILVVSVVLYRLVEQPFMGWGRKRSAVTVPPSPCLYEAR